LVPRSPAIEVLDGSLRTSVVGAALEATSQVRSEPSSSNVSSIEVIFKNSFARFSIG
jgi:hypothetical protein